MRCNEPGGIASRLPSARLVAAVAELGSATTQVTVITSQQFKQRWERVSSDRLTAFPESSLADVRLPTDARAFLAEAGLPDEAAPFLNFKPPKRGTLERVSHIYRQPPVYDRYRIIGGNGSGDPVCLDEEADGQIVYLNHDNR